MATVTARRGRKALEEMRRQNMVAQEVVEEEEIEEEDNDDMNSEEEIWMVTWVDRHNQRKFFQTDDLRLATETLKRLQRGTRNSDFKLELVV